MRCELRDHAAAEHHERAVASQLDLGQLGREEEHGGARRGQLTQDAIDLFLGADVDAACGVETEERHKTGGQPPRDRDLLLVASGQSHHAGPGSRVYLQPVGCRLHTLALGSCVDQPPALELVDHG